MRTTEWIPHLARKNLPVDDWLGEKKSGVFTCAWPLPTHGESTDSGQME